MGMNVNISQAGAVGATATTPFSVSGIKSGDVLLGVWSWAPAAAPTGIDVSEATVADGTVALDTTSTDAKNVWVVWYTPPAS